VGFHSNERLSQLERGSWFFSSIDLNKKRCWQISPTSKKYIQLLSVMAFKKLLL